MPTLSSPVRLLALGLLALAIAAPAQSQQRVYQQRIEPEPASTFVVSAMPGEAVRITTYDRRPAERGRLARRYLGLRANRTAHAAARPVALRPVTPLIESPSGTFVRRGTSYFPVVRRR